MSTGTTRNPRAWAMTEPLSRADHYRKEAAKYQELAKVTRI
jgi:hypothetical protein